MSEERDKAEEQQEQQVSLLGLLWGLKLDLLMALGFFLGLVRQVKFKGAWGEAFPFVGTGILGLSNNCQGWICQYPYWYQTTWGLLFPAIVVLVGGIILCRLFRWNWLTLGFFVCLMFALLFMKPVMIPVPLPAG